MTTYDLQGKFYEACDCEVICSCWVGLPPEMGSCTGLFVWDIETGTIGSPSIDVSGSRVVVMSSGKSCDISKYMLVLIQSTHKTEIENAFKDPGAWRDVFQAQSFVPGTYLSIPPTDATICIKDTGNTIEISIKTIDPTIVTKAKLNFTITPATITGRNATPKLLVDQVVGNDPISNKSVSVGVVDTPLTATQNGLNLLADIPGVYTFDLDISRVTAMRGNFHYTN